MRWCLIVMRWCLIVAICGESIVNISNVEPRRDVQNELMDIHDGNLLELNGTFYWWGMGYGNCTETTGVLPPRDCPGIYDKFGGCGFRTDHAVNLYTSTDLMSWEYQGNVLPVASRPFGIYFRPKIIHNKKTDEWVLWINYLSEAPTPLKAYPNATYLVAVSRSAKGPFTVINQKVAVMNSGGGDFALIVDPYSRTADAYIAYDSWSTKHRISIEKLTVDYHDSLGEQASSGLISPENNEAPMLFARNGWYYLIFGHTCCFCSEGANSKVYTSKHLLGPWNDTGIDINAQHKDIKAQESFVFEVQTASGPERVYMGDLWTSAFDHLKSHDPQFWHPLSFDDSADPPTIGPLKWIDSFELNLTSVLCM